MSDKILFVRTMHDEMLKNSGEKTASILCTLFFVVMGGVCGAATAFGVLSVSDAHALLSAVQVDIAFSLTVSLASSFIFCASAYLATVCMIGIVPLLFCVALKATTLCFCVVTVLRFVVFPYPSAILLATILLPNALLCYGLYSITLISTSEWIKRILKKEQCDYRVRVKNTYYFIASGVMLEGVIAPLLLRVLIH